MAKKKVKKKSRKQQSKKKFNFQEFWTERKDVFKFLFGFLFLVLLLFALSATDLFDAIREPLTHIYASVSGFILNLFGSNTTASGDVLSSSKFAISVEAGCDGVAPMILYWATIAVFPMNWKYKWQGLLYGTIFLFVLNLIRIISLFLAGIYARSVFDFLHVDVWQILFIAFTIFIWVYWYKWAHNQSLSAVAVSKQK